MPHLVAPAHSVTTSCPHADVLCRRSPKAIIGKRAHVLHQRILRAFPSSVGHTRGVKMMRRQGWRAYDRIRRLASYVVALVGLLGLLSAISRPARGRLQDLLQVLPFVVPRSAAITLVFVSFALLLTARGLRHGQRLAWASTLLLLATSAVLHVLKGLDAEESVVVVLVLVGLATQHAAFPVLPSRAVLLRTVALGAGGALVAVVVATGLGELVGSDAYPRFGESAEGAARGLGGSEPLSLRGVGGFITPMLVATGLGLLVSTLWLLLSPRLSVPLTASEHLFERERARRVFRVYGGDTLAYFALRDDKRWFFTGSSVVAHAVRNGVCLVSPDPIGPETEREEVWAEFMTYAQRNGWSVSVIGALPDWLPVYEASGLRSLYLGDEAIVDCQGFTLQGRPMKSLRSARNRVVRTGYTASFHDPAALEPQLEAALTAMSANSRRGEVERGFSMTLSRLFDPADTGLMLAVARRSDGRVGGFIQWIPAADIDGWSLDVMRRRHRGGHAQRHHRLPHPGDHPTHPRPGRPRPGLELRGAAYRRLRGAERGSPQGRTHPAPPGIGPFAD